MSNRAGERFARLQAPRFQPPPAATRPPSAASGPDLVQRQVLCLLSAAAGAQRGFGSQEFKFEFSLLYSFPVWLFLLFVCFWERELSLCEYIIAPVAVVSKFLESLMNEIYRNINELNF